jgi:hypothetical protein
MRILTPKIPEQEEIRLGTHWIYIVSTLFSLVYFTLEKIPDLLRFSLTTRKFEV